MTDRSVERPRGRTRVDGPAAPVIVAPGTLPVGRASALPLREEGPAKLTGEALYADDLVFPGAWYGATVRSTQARARLLGIDRDETFAWDRVVVVMADDIPGENVVSLIDDDQPILVPVGGEIRHHAEPLALVAAPDRATLAEATARLRVRTEALPPVLDPLASTEIIAEHDIVVGDVEAGFAAAAVVVEGTYHTGHQEQLYIEPQAMIAVPEPDGGVTVHGSLQCPYYVLAALARGLGEPVERVRVVQAVTGGGFGGKEEYPSMVALHAALLARAALRPVRMIYGRHEDLAATTKRHPSIVRHRSAFTDDGALLAQDIDLVLDGGAYTTLTPVVLSRATLHAGGPYRCPNVRIRSRAVRTNTPPNGAFRGFGAPQAHFGAEIQLSKAAEVLGLSPAEVRRRNVYRTGDTTPTGQILRESVAAEEVLARAVEASGFEAVRTRTAEAQASAAASSPDPRDPVRTGPVRVAEGIGLALAWHGAGFTGSGEVKLASVAAVELGQDGGVRVLAGSTEIGQGSRTVFRTLVAEALGIELDAVDVAPVDTAIVPDSGPTVASRTTMVVGGLLVRAARDLRHLVEERNGGRPFADVRAKDARRHGSTRVDRRFEAYPGIHFDDATYHGDAYPAYGWAAAVADVAVDLDTFEVDVRSVTAVDDAGRVVHPVLAEGQVEGGTLQAVGYATIEEIQVDGGRYRNDRLATYLIPTSLDAPRITAIMVEAPFSMEPHGAKGLGELPMDVAAPAVVAAIHDAVGVWVDRIPATPERIMAKVLGAAGDRAEAADEEGRP
jgi:CO/xanthine dehydrogenase Mo-binding subunit